MIVDIMKNLPLQIILQLALTNKKIYHIFMNYYLPMYGNIRIKLKIFDTNFVLNIFENIKAISFDDIKYINNEILKKMVNVKKIDLSHSPITELDLSLLTNLRVLDISNTKIKNEDLKYLTNIRSLNLFGCNITDSGLIYLDKVQNIVLLHTDITSNGLQYLQNVRRIFISISDSKIKYIFSGNLRYLRELYTVCHCDTDITLIVNELKKNKRIKVYIDYYSFSHSKICENLYPILEKESLFFKNFPSLINHYDMPELMTVNSIN